MLWASYAYDAWGTHKIYNVLGDEVINYSSGSPGHFNPFRYRGYYYDVETGLYYLNSRYYDPEIGRFINADIATFLEPETVNGLNLYSYCRSNPVNIFLGIGIDLGQGWEAFIHAANEIVQRHLHIYFRKKFWWSQNDDGSPHDEGKNKPGGPPKWMREELQRRLGWDWEKKQKEWDKKKKKDSAESMQPRLMPLDNPWRAGDDGSSFKELFESAIAWWQNLSTETKIVVIAGVVVVVVITVFAPWAWFFAL